MTRFGGHESFSWRRCMELRNYIATSDFTNSQFYRIHFWVKDQAWLRKKDTSRIFSPKSLKVWPYIYISFNL